MRPPTGRRIVVELEREMQERLYPLFYRTLPPAEYHVYLHPDDYRHVEAVVPLIVADAQQHLNQEVDRLNSRRRWAFVGERLAPIEAPPGGWAIFIHAAANGEVNPGELGIVSRLAIPPSSAFDGGAPTVRIGRTVVTDTVRRMSTSEGPAPEVASGLPGATLSVRRPVEVPSRAVPSRSVDARDSTRLALPTASPCENGQPMLRAGETTLVAHGDPWRQPGPIRGASPGFAMLAYVDEDGPHLFTIRKDVISIGRGGDAHWVDVQVATTARVSREHCRIHREASGEFFIEDVSMWGLSVDGQRVHDRSPALHKLPSRASIDLAGALAIEFTAQAER